MTDELFLKKLETIEARLATDYSLFLELMRNCHKDTIASEIHTSLHCIYQVRVSTQRMIHYHNNKDFK